MMGLSATTFIAFWSHSRIIQLYSTLCEASSVARPAPQRRISTGSAARASLPATRRAAYAVAVAFTNSIWESTCHDATKPPVLSLPRDDAHRCAILRAAPGGRRPPRRAARIGLLLRAQL